MNMNHHTRLPRPGPECESFAPLLALAGQERLDPREGSALRAHLATCDYCQAEQDAYQRLDSALQRHFGPPAQPPLSGRDIAQMIQDDEMLPAQRSDPPAAAMLRDERPPSQTPRPLPAERPQRPQRRRAVVISAISAVAAVLVIALISVALFVSGGHVLTGAHPKTPTATQNVAPTATPAPYTPNPNDTFNSIAMVSPNEGWIVGGSGSHAGPLIVHYLNGRLFQANIVAPPSGWPPLSLQHVVMSSATEGWTVGPVEGLCPSSLLLRYTRGQWKLDSTMTGISLFDISMLSPTDGWATGDQQTCGQGDHKPVLLHYNGTTWTPVQLPADVIQVTGVSMTSATDGWAVGTKQASGSAGNPNLLLHYDGQTWSEVNTAGMTQYGVNLGGIAMISSTDGWLVGILNQGPNGTASGAMLFHYDGKQWSKVNTPLDTQQGGVLSLSLAPSGDGWLVGDRLGKDTFFLQLSGGTWKKVDSPTDAFVSQVFTLSANDAWAVGPGIGQGQLFLLHYHNGAWENVPLTPAPTATATSTTASCDTVSGPTLPPPGPGTPVPTIPFTTWTTYTDNATFSINYPAGWQTDDSTCGVGHLDLIVTNYHMEQVMTPGLPPGGIKIELNLSEGPQSGSAFDFWSLVQQANQQAVGGPACPAFTTRQLQIDGRSAVEGGCPSLRWDSFIIPDGKNMLDIMESAANGVQPSAVLTQMVNSLTFTS